jgi:hypothetical protein
MYDLPPVKMTRTASLGFGNKYDFTKENKGKSQVFYNVAKDFDPKLSGAPAFTFGVARSFYDKVYCEANKMLDKNVPGPGLYTVRKPFGSDTTKISMTGKGKGEINKSKINDPGPGSYKPIGMTVEGKYPTSRMRNTATITFGVNKEKRFRWKSNSEKNPAPNQYNLKWLITGKGFIYSSKFKSSPCSSMQGKGKDLSTKYTNYLTPGPGSYRTFSEFGIYEKKADIKKP